MGNTVVLSDDAWPFRIPNHALCWVHAERLLQKLMPKAPQQVRKLEAIRDQVWALYRDLKLWKLAPARPSDLRLLSVSTISSGSTPATSCWTNCCGAYTGARGIS